MPIEDVEYLKKNSVKQSYMFLIDSSDRERATHPHPSEYIVEFTTPFQNVVGLEVIDASIPRTMYNVDTINHSISFYIHSPTISAGSLSNMEYQTVHVPIGDYTIQTLIPALNSILHMHIDNDPLKPLASITAETTTNPPDIQSTLRFRCPYPFFLVMNASTIAETLGFDAFTQANEANVPILERRYEAPFQSEIQGLPVAEANVSRYTKMFHSVDIDPAIQMGSERTVFDGPRGVLRRISMAPAGKRVAQRFSVTTDGYLTQIYAALSAEAPLDTIPSFPVLWEVYPQNTVTQLPDTSSAPLANGTIAISYVDGSLSDSSLTSTFLEGGQSYWLVLHVEDANNGTGVYYNDVLASESSLYISNSDGDPWTLAADSQGIYYQMSARIIMKDRYHVLTSPGIYSLVGPRYIILRCPEIEENSFRSLAYSKHHLGLAKFRMGVVGYSENRLDFSKVPLREFHPIGKLKKMTLRFELASGELYNFRDVNHTITFAIHYYEPVQKEDHQRAYMNPNYKANFLDYMYSQEQQESDSDDQAEDFSRDRMMDYRQRELMYLPENLRRRDLQYLMDGPTNFREDASFEDEDDDF